MRIKNARKELIKDFIFVLIGIFIAIVLSRLGIVDLLVNAIGNDIVASFLSGIFFTSVFTVGPSSVALVSISEASHFTIAFWGAIGALFGDLVLFYFIRDRFSDNLVSSIKPSVVKKVISSFHLGFMKWLAPFLGAIIIASPLPDELGLTLLGLSKTRIAVLIPISLVMNFLGILALLFFADVTPL